MGGARRGRAGRAGQAEATEDHFARARDEDGAGPQGQVQDVVGPGPATGASVQRLQAVTDLGGDVQKDVVGQVPALGAARRQHPFQVHAVDVILYGVPVISVNDPVEDLNQVGVPNADEIADSAFDAGQPWGVLEVGEQDAANDDVVVGIGAHVAEIRRSDRPSCELSRQREGTHVFGEAHHGREPGGRGRRGILGEPGSGGDPSPECVADVRSKLR